MKTVIRYSIFILQFAMAFGCKSYSKYPIDEKPLVKIDTNLLGIWKVVEDTNKKDYILVQTRDNDHPQNHGKRKEEKKEGYFMNNERCYYVTRVDADGRNPHYYFWGVFLSTVGREMYFNVSYLYQPLPVKSTAPPDPKEWYARETYSVADEESGYFFVHIINISHNSMTTAVVADTTLKYLTSAKEVRNRIEKNLNNPGFYSDTLHFYKVSSYHESLSGSMLRAN